MARKKKKGVSNYELWLQYAATRSVETRNTLILCYMRRVQFLAERLVQRLPRSVILEDMISAGCKGLLEGVEGFDLSRGFQPETYLSVRIRGAMIDELRSLDWVPRVVRGKTNEYVDAVRVLTQEHGRAPTVTEVAEYLGTTEADVEKRIHDFTQSPVLSGGGGEDASERNSGKRLLDIPDPYSREDFLDMQRLDLVKFLLGHSGLSDIEASVIALCFFKDMTMDEVGNFLGLSESRICQVHTRAIRKLQECALGHFPDEARFLRLIA